MNKEWLAIDAVSNHVVGYADSKEELMDVIAKGYLRGISKVRIYQADGVEQVVGHSLTLTPVEIVVEPPEPYRPKGQFVHGSATCRPSRWLSEKMKGC